MILSVHSLTPNGPDALYTRNNRLSHNLEKRLVVLIRHFHHVRPFKAEATDRTRSSSQSQSSKLAPEAHSNGTNQLHAGGTHTNRWHANKSLSGVWTFTRAVRKLQILHIYNLCFSPGLDSWSIKENFSRMNGESLPVLWWYSSASSSQAYDNVTDFVEFCYDALILEVLAFIVYATYFSLRGLP